MFSIELFGVINNPAKSARNLGVIFDKNFTFRSHISAVCNSCFNLIRDMWSIRSHLDVDSAKLLPTALVARHLACCDSLLFGIMATDVTKLQRVQKRLARLVTKSPLFTCTVSLLRSLYWLPIKFRILSGIGSPVVECSTVTQTAGVRAQLTAVSCGLRQATLPTCATWSGSEGYCIVE